MNSNTFVEHQLCFIAYSHDLDVVVGRFALGDQYSSTVAATGRFDRAIHAEDSYAHGYQKQNGEQALVYAQNLATVRSFWRIWGTWLAELGDDQANHRHEQ